MNCAPLLKIRVASYEAYRGPGPLHDDARSEGYAMAEGLTLGLAEPLLCPEAIRERRALKQRAWTLLFWFDEDGRLVAYQARDW